MSQSVAQFGEWCAPIGEALAARVTALSHVRRGHDADELVRAIVSHNEIGPFVGAPPGTAETLGGRTPYAEFLTHLWGRRCLYFFEQARAGLVVAVKLSPRTRGFDAVPVEELEGILELLRGGFAKGLNIPDKEPINLANHHVTYIDPVLFSALYLLHTARERGIQLKPDQTRELLLTDQQQVASYTRGGTDVAPDLQDESTLWWGVVRLHRDMPDDFRVGKLDGNGGVLQLLRVLVKRQDPKFPSADIARREATFDMHNETRTRLWIVKNALYFLGADHGLPKDLASSLTSLVYNHLVKVSGKQREVGEHCYFAGLAMDVFGSALLLSAQRGEGVLVPGPALASGPLRETLWRVEAWLRREKEKRGVFWVVVGSLLALVLGALALL